MAPIDQAERLQLCDLLLELGPDAPTLCEGWTTADLAAHLVLREHLHRWGDSRRAAEKARGFDALVARLRAGPPLVWRVPGARELVNGFEYFVHHEDVRRANGRPPRADNRLEDLSWRASGFLGRRLARALKPWGLQLTTPDGRSRTFGHGTTGNATLSGPATEIGLYLAGRRSAAVVSLDGPAGAVAAAQRAQVKL